MELSDVGDIRKMNVKHPTTGAENLFPSHVQKTRLTNVGIGQLKPYQKNPKKNTQKSVDAVAASIKELGYLKTSITVDEDWVLLTGHTTLKALKKLGYLTVPEVDVIKGLTEDEKTLYRINDNKLATIDEWDKKVLSELYATLDNDLKDISGFSDEDFEEEPQEIQEEPEDTRTVNTGDIWKLGRHYLFCGSSTEPASYENLPEPTFILTDPPYGINVVKGNHVGGEGLIKFTEHLTRKSSKKNIGSTKLASSTYKEIANDDNTDAAKAFYELHKDKKCVLFGGNYYTDFVPVSRCWLVWNKHTTGNFADAELAWTNLDSVVKLYDWTWNGVSREGKRNEEGRTRIHPSQKPVGLMKKILEDFTTEQDIVLDGFGGSGSTLIACEATNRTCICMELDPEYCKSIIVRYEQFTGDKAVKWTST